MTRMTHRATRRMGLLAASALLAGAFVVTSAGPASACGRQWVFDGLRAGNMETIALRTFHVEIHPKSKKYNLGEVAKIAVKVTRPAKEDPGGNGIEFEPPFSEPAEDVVVGVGLSIGRVYLPGAAITDANGEATVRIKIESWAPAGKWAAASAYAWKIAHQNQCLTVQEDGYTADPRFFKTTD